MSSEAPDQPVDASHTEAPGLDAEDVLDDLKLLFQAARTGDMQALQAILASGEVSANACDAEQWRPLHFAAQCGKTEAVQYLIEQKADPLAKKGDGSTAMHDAGYNGNVSILALLLENKASVNDADEDGWTPLHYAAASGNGDAFAFLIKSGADPKAETKDGKTMFKLASAEGHQEIIGLLEDVMDLKEERADLKGASAARIGNLEDQLTKALSDKAELEAELSQYRDPNKDTKNKKKNQRKKAKKTKEQVKAESDVKALDEALNLFTGNAAELEVLMEDKKKEIAEAAKDKFAPDEKALYHDEIIQLYGLQLDLGTKTSEELGYTLHTTSYVGVPVDCVLVEDVLFHPYFKDHVGRQVAYIATIPHPNLSLFMGVHFQSLDAKPMDIESPLKLEAEKLKDTQLCLVYESVDRTMADVLKAGGQFTYKQTVDIMMGLVSAVAHIHKRGHVHNNITFSSVGLDKHMRPKLTRFGVASVCNIFRRSKLQHPAQEWYCAPEQLSTKKKEKDLFPKLYDYGSPKSDIYALGIMLLTMCTMKEGPERAPNAAASIKSGELRNLVLSMIKPKPEDRAGLDKVLLQLCALKSNVGYTQ